MGRRNDKPDRYLVKRGGVFQYHLKVPASVRNHDSRWPKIRATLIRHVQLWRDEFYGPPAYRPHEVFGMEAPKLDPD